MSLFTRDLACRQAVALISDYLENGLTGRERRRLERHLAGCGACTAYLEQMKETIALTGTVTVEDVGQEALDELVEVYLRFLDDEAAE